MVYTVVLGIAIGLTFPFFPDRYLLALGSSADVNQLMPVIFGGAVLVAIAIIRSVTEERLWKIFLSLGGIAGVFVSFLVLAYFVMPLTVAYGVAFVLTAALFWYYQKYPKVIVHNLISILAIGGLSRVFAVQLNPNQLLLALCILAAYDAIATYGAQYLFSLAQRLFARTKDFGIILPNDVAMLAKNVDRQKKSAYEIVGILDLAIPIFFVASNMIYRGIEAGLVIGSFLLTGASIAYALHNAASRRFPILPLLTISVLAGHYLSLLMFSL